MKNNVHITIKDKKYNTLELDICVPLPIRIKEMLMILSESYHLQHPVNAPVVRIVQTGTVWTGFHCLLETDIQDGHIIQIEEW